MLLAKKLGEQFQKLLDSELDDKVIKEVNKSIWQVFIAKSCDVEKTSKLSKRIESGIKQMKNKEPKEKILDFLYKEVSLFMDENEVSGVAELSVIVDGIKGINTKEEVKKIEGDQIKVKLNDKEYLLIRSYDTSQQPIKTVFNYESYKVTFEINQEDLKSSYRAFYRINLYYDNKNVQKYNFTMDASKRTVVYSLLRISPEEDAFTVRTYDKVEEMEKIAAQAIEKFEQFKREVLKDMPFDDYEKIRSEAVEYTKKAFQDARYFLVTEVTKYFLRFRFEPKENAYNYWLNAAHDYKNKRYYVLNTIESLEYFLKRNRVELNNGKNEKLVTEKNKEILVDLIKDTSENQFKRVYYDDNNITKISHVNEDNKPEIEKRIAPFKKILKPPTIKGNKLTLYLLTTWFPSELEEWIVVEKGFEFEINTKTILKQVYVPGFVTQESASGEEELRYIR